MMIIVHRNRKTLKARRQAPRAYFVAVRGMIQAMVASWHDEQAMSLRLLFLVYD